MDYRIALLFVIAILNAGFSYFILRGERSKPDILFSLVALSVSLWSVNLAFFIESPDAEASLLFANAYYIAAAAIPLLFFYFSVFFPEKEGKEWRTAHYLYLLPFAALIAAFLVDKHFILQEILFTERGKDVVLIKPAYILYSLYFLFYVTLSYYHAIHSYRNAKDKLQRTQLTYIIGGTLISYLLGMTFNLFLPFIGNYQAIWLGPLFTLIMIFSLGYAILKHHLFDVKVIATEILTFSLWFFILVRTLVSQTLEDQLINGGLLVITVISGIFLIKSVTKEVEAREKIERLAEDLEKANTRLKELDQQKSEFVSIASHQLRSPLTAIKGYTSMILEGSFGATEPKVKEAVGRVFESSKHLAAVVEDLLNVSKIEQGGMKFEFGKVDFGKIAKEIVEDLRPNAESAGITLRIADDGKAPYYVNADYEKLRQVALNLIDNAIKYTPKGEVDAFMARDTSKGTVTFSVKDSGIGVPKELQDRLFEKFSRGTGISKINTGGSGLGLYLVKEIVKAHGGRVWVESPGEGKGSVFFAELKAL